MTRLYSLRKCRKILDDAVIRYKTLSKRLSSELLAQLGTLIDNLDSSIQKKNVESARIDAYNVQQFLLEHGRKTLFEQIREFTLAILFALIIAALVRQMWFELYEIPTGSMRPTFRESDRVLVFKDTFCINKPFETSHFYFEPQYVKRGSIVVLTGDGLDLPDVDTVYFGLFPGKRRYVKRCVAKDGDTIYFYGGKIYGIDKEGKPLNDLLELPYEYIPFISFEGKVEQEKDSYIIEHMNIPVAEISVSYAGTLHGKPIGPTQSFGRDWGIDNFAISRLLEPKDVENPRDDALLYLELKHTPRLPTLSTQNLLVTEHSRIPLDDAHCQILKSSLYTARFYVRNGTAFRYTPEGPDLKGRGVFLDRKIPDGCYEFYDGNAYEIGWGAILHLLPPSHPIYPTSIKMLKALYNSGIDLSSSTNSAKKHNHFPSRYTYFRDGALYTMGKILFQKDDPTLSTFVDDEKAKRGSYVPFVDKGAPSIDEIKTYGLTIPNGHYLLLGDNHAMSNDSRFFGAVPQKNLQGSPALTFWPPGSRWGAPPQPELPFWRASKVIVVVLAAIVAWICYAIYNRRTQTKRLKK